MRAFIVRPFGRKAGIDFDRVQAELIDPTLVALGVTGRTTGEILAAGNIRGDMFERLLAADLVIADISIDNANVYYELGIRHAMRDRMTVLIRAQGDEDPPFDVATDRYLAYDAGDPAATRATLRATIEQTDAARRVDSPVFRLLPALRPVDPESLQVVPPEFSEEVTRAQRNADKPLLGVLQDEVARFDWAIAGLRLIGRAQFAVTAWADARATWEAVRRALPDDPEANLKLATVFQRLGEPTLSTAAIERVLARPGFEGHQRAEALSLKASNLKVRWIDAWCSAAEDRRQTVAVRSPLLEESRLSYDEGFLADQNHWYAGINVLALTTVTLLLADRVPDVWAERFADDEEAATELRRLRRAHTGLEAAVRRSLDAGAARRARTGEPPDPWLEVTRADLVLLTSDRPAQVRSAYAQALSRVDEGGGAGGGIAAEAAARQIRLYRDLGVFVETAPAALGALGDPPPRREGARQRVLVFAGHRIDEAGREPPRFPRSAEAKAAQMVAAAVEAQAGRGGPIHGLAGAASGGDILFHEACRAMGITTTVLLALPRDAFAAASVRDAGGDWVERFRRLCDHPPIEVLADRPELPGWLREPGGYTIWQRNNRWVLHHALSYDNADVTLIVLWDGGAGEPGGTADMVRLATDRGVEVVHLDARPLAGPPA